MCPLQVGYTQPDYDVWESHFGESAGSGSGASANAAVPERACALLLLTATLTTCAAVEKRKNFVSKPGRR